MREGLAIGFHAVTFLQYAFAVFYDYTYTIVPHNVTSVHNVYGGKFKFLTFWDAVSIDVSKVVSLMKLAKSFCALVSVSTYQTHSSHISIPLIPVTEILLRQSSKETERELSRNCYYARIWSRKSRPKRCNKISSLYSDQAPFQDPMESIVTEPYYVDLVTF